MPRHHSRGLHRQSGPSETSTRKRAIRSTDFPSLFPRLSAQAVEDDRLVGGRTVARQPSPGERQVAQAGLAPQGLDGELELRLVAARAVSAQIGPVRARAMLAAAQSRGSAFTRWSQLETAQRVTASTVSRLRESRTLNVRLYRSRVRDRSGFPHGDAGTARLPCGASLPRL